MSKKNQNYTNRKQNRFQPERMRGNVFVNNSGKQWLPGENGRAAKIERLLRGAKEEKKEIAGNMAGYKDSGVEWIGAIPKGWKVNKLKYICHEYGKTSLMHPENNKYIGLENVISYSDVINTTDTEYTESIQKVCKKGALLFSKLRPYLAKVIIAPFDGYCTNEFLEFDYFYGDMRFLKHCLRNPKFINEVDNTTYGVKMPRTNTGIVLNQYIPLPPLPEQQRIADFLDAKCGILDRTIDAVSRQIEDLEKYKKALITKTVTKGICKKGEPERAMKDSGVEWIGEVPEEWSVKPFKALAGMKGSSEYTARDIVDEGEGAILLSPSNINDNKLNLSKRTYISQKKYDKSTTKIQRGDLLFTKTASVGKCVIYDSDEPAMPNPQLVVLKNIKCLPKFLYYSMVSDVMQAPTKMYVYGSVIPTISQLNLGRIKIPVPSPEEQQQIAEYLNEKCKNIDNRVQKRRQQLEWLKEYKKSLIFDYVTGKKRV